MAERDSQTYAIIGGAMEVHRELRRGFLEAVYHDALEIELESRGIPYLREASLRVYYKGRPLNTPYRADFVCHGRVVVELKATRALGPHDEAQILHYLRATGFRVGLLLNFGAHDLEWRRFVV